MNKNEEKLNNNLYKNIIDFLDFFLIVMNEKGYIIYVNEKFQNLLGYSLAKILHTHVTEFIPKNYHKKFVEYFQDVLKKEELKEIEIPFQKEDGSLILLEGDSKTIHLKEKVAVINILRKKSEKLHFSEWNAIFENNYLPIAIINQKLFFLKVNKEFENLTLYKNEELENKVNLIDLIPESRKAEVYSYCLEQMQRNYQAEKIQCRFFNKRKEAKEIEISLSFVPEAGKAVVFFKDLTKIKRLEEQVLRSEKLSTLGEMIASIAHELNNPLSAVIGFSGLLLGEEMEGGKREMIERIYNDAQRCHKIVRNLLSLVRGKPAEKKLVNLNQIVEKTIEIKEYDLRLDNIEVEKRLDPSIPNIEADWHQIQQVLLNLINNAHYAIVNQEKGNKIIVETKLENSNILLKVADNGPGIPEKYLSKIFEPFFTTKEDSKSAGLGLAIVKRIVEDHGGEIKVESKLGEGTVFFIELPAKKIEEEKEKAEVLIPKERIKTKKRVLVVEDEPSVAELFKFMLKKHGCEVEIAKDGREAFQFLKEKNFDFLISDIRMPGMDGKMLYKTIKDKKIFRPDAIILTSGDMLGDRTQEFIRASKIKFLPKPFKEEDLLRLIEEIFKKEKK
ncbi:PAS domain S-box protein [Candidatus Aminicenantes bacterium AH-873-B07]|jgi:PAS domain S-box-containing protein|nr:PAS domain S-box protein [Candidatus Aminicenantes bacterium AH-873-B07]